MKTAMNLKRSIFPNMQAGNRAEGAVKSMLHYFSESLKSLTIKSKVNYECNNVDSAYSVPENAEIKKVNFTEEKNNENFPRMLYI